MERKYEFTEQTQQVEGRTLHRIKALRSFGNVKEGDLGGWIESEENLSHEGNAWIADEAKAYGKVFVFEDANIQCRACLMGNCSVYGKAKVGGFAEISGDIRIGGHVGVFGTAKIKGKMRICGDAVIG